MTSTTSLFNQLDKYKCVEKKFDQNTAQDMTTLVFNNTSKEVKIAAFKFVRLQANPQLQKTSNSITVIIDFASNDLMNAFIKSAADSSLAPLIKPAQKKAWDKKDNKPVDASLCIGFSSANLENIYENIFGILFAIHQFDALDKPASKFIYHYLQLPGLDFSSQIERNFLHAEKNKGGIVGFLNACHIPLDVGAQIASLVPIAPHSKFFAVCRKGNELGNIYLQNAELTLTKPKP